MKTKAKKSAAPKGREFRYTPPAAPQPVAHVHCILCGGTPCRCDTPADPPPHFDLLCGVLEKNLPALDSLKGFPFEVAVDLASDDLAPSFIIGEVAVTPAFIDPAHPRRRGNVQWHVQSIDVDDREEVYPLLSTALAFAAARMAGRIVSNHRVFRD